MPKISGEFREFELTTADDAEMALYWVGEALYSSISGDCCDDSSVKSILSPGKYLVNFLEYFVYV